MVYYSVDFSLTVEDSFTHQGRFGTALQVSDAARAEKEIRSRAAHEARELYPLARQIEVSVLQVNEIPAEDYVIAEFGLIVD